MSRCQSIAASYQAAPRRTLSTRRCAVGIVAALLAFMLASATHAAPPLPVAGDGEHLWIVQSAEAVEADAGEVDEVDNASPPRWIVRHRAVGDPAAALDYAGTLNEPVEAAALAASQRTLWMIDQRGALHLLRATPAEARPGWAYDRRRGPSLPSDTAPRAFDVGEAGTFALVRVTSAAALRAIDEAPASPEIEGLREQQLLRWLILGIPPTDAVVPEDESQADPDLDIERLPLPPGPVMRAEPVEDEPVADEPPTEPDHDTEHTLDDEPADVDRLLRLERARWRNVAMPERWSAHHEAGAHVALLAPARGRPLRLLAQEANELHIYERRDAQGEAPARWDHQMYALDDDAPVTAMILENQLIAAQPNVREAALRLSVLRRGSVRPVGVLRIDVEGDRATAVGAAPVRAAAALVVETDAPAVTRRGVRIGELWWARMNLRGEIETEPTRLEEADAPALEHLTDYVILVAVLVLAVMLMLLFWRRDPSQFQLVLPPDQALGPLPRRVAAGAIDLAPALLAPLIVFEIGFAELFHRWPGVGQARTLEDIAPGALAIGVFVGHTMVGELIFARSLGKAILGLRVATLRGERPRFWQMLVRNLLKSFDLVAWLLLVLIAIGPFRQRLGDLIARTVVVMPRQADDEAQESDDERDDEQE